VFTARYELGLEMKQSVLRLLKVKLQTAGNNPKESIRHTKHGESLNTRVIVIWKAGSVIFVVSVLNGHTTFTWLWVWFMKMCEDSDTEVEDTYCNVSLSVGLFAGILRLISLSRSSKSICAQLRKNPV
jgi:hypothetical protein